MQEVAPADPRVALLVPAQGCPAGRAVAKAYLIAGRPPALRTGSGSAFESMLILRYSGTDETCVIATYSYG